MKFTQGYYTIEQIKNLINIHSEGQVHITRVWQENKQLCILTSNNLRLKIRLV